jgi:hypothetical protein
VIEAQPFLCEGNAIVPWDGAQRVAQSVKPSSGSRVTPLCSLRFAGRLPTRIVCTNDPGQRKLIIESVVN